MMIRRKPQQSKTYTDGRASIHVNILLDDGVMLHVSQSLPTGEVFAWLPKKQLVIEPRSTDQKKILAYMRVETTSEGYEIWHASPRPDRRLRATFRIPLWLLEQTQLRVVDEEQVVRV